MCQSLFLAPGILSLLPLFARFWHVHPSTRGSEGSCHLCAPAHHLLGVKRQKRATPPLDGENQPGCAPQPGSPFSLLLELVLLQPPRRATPRAGRSLSPGVEPGHPPSHVHPAPGQPRTSGWFPPLMSQPCPLLQPLFPSQGHRNWDEGTGGAVPDSRQRK